MNIKDIFKQKKVYITLVGAILMTAFCVVMMLMPKQSYFYEGEHFFKSGVVETNAVVYDQIKLPVGVYKVELEYQTNTKNLCTVTDGTVRTGALLTNGEHLYEHLGCTSFRIWLFENTDAMQVSVDYGGEGQLTTGNLTIRETNDLWSMLLVVIWSITILTVGISAFQQYDRTVGIEKERKTIVFGLMVIVLLASLPYLQGTGVCSGADLVYHLMRIEGVKDGILSGQFPLRLEPEWLFGHGYANGIFYCNTLLYLPGILRLLGFTVSACYNIYCIALNFATACIAYYCFKNIFQSRYIGLLCSALYTLSIFRIYKLTITAALGEGSAVTFMPLVLYGLYRVFTEDVNQKAYKKVWIPIAIGYAGLMQTHVLSCEITAFLTILVCMVFIKRILVKQTFLELVKGAVGAIAMSCWYLVPFLDYYMNEDVHIRHVSARTIQDRGLYLPQLFYHWWKLGDNAVSGDLGMVESHAMGIGMLLVMGFALFCILWFCGKWRIKKDKIISLGKVSCILGGMLMLMSLNTFPWDFIQHLNGLIASLVSSLQFPNRFLGWGTVFLVTVYGCLLWYFKKNKKKWYYYVGVTCVLVAISTSSVYLLDYVCRDKIYLYIHNEEGMETGYISGAEYLIEGTEQELLQYNVPDASEEVDIIAYDKEYLHMWVNCVNESTMEGYIELPLLYYTGYRAYVTSSGEELIAGRGNNNIVRVSIPAGFEGEVEVKFVSPMHWRISELVTYIWYLGVGVACIRHLWRKQKEKREKSYA